MKNRLFRLISLAVGGGMIASSLALVAPASTAAAATVPSDQGVVKTTTNYKEECTTAGQTDTCVSGSSYSESTSQGMSIDRLKIKGRIVGEFLVKGGLTKKQIKGKACWWAKDGFNSFRDSIGKINVYKDERRQYVCQTNKGPSGVQVVKCGNLYWPKGRPPKRYKIVRNPVVVRSLDKYALTGKVKVKTVTKSTSKSVSVATCKGSSGTGSGSGYAYAVAYATLRFKFRHRRSFEAEGTRVQEQHNQSVNLSMFAKAKAEAITESRSGAWCTDVVIPPSVTPKPQLLEIDTINDVLVNNTRTITPKGTVASGHTATLSCSAGTGSITSGKTQTVSGSFNAPITYKAPDEVGTDKVTCTLTQDDGQATSISTNEFVIRKLPPDPA